MEDVCSRMEASLLCEEITIFTMLLIFGSQQQDCFRVHPQTLCFCLLVVVFLFTATAVESSHRADG
jgi:hypothetical protein